jgi:serine/threonine protein kinase
MPFYGRTIKETFRANVKGIASFKGRAWKQVSPQAKKFVQELLTIDPQFRPSAEQALEHEWLVGDDLTRELHNFTRDQGHTSRHIDHSLSLCGRTCTELSGGDHHRLSMRTMTGVGSSTSTANYLQSACGRACTEVSSVGSACACLYCRTYTDGFPQRFIRTCTDSIQSVKSLSSLPSKQTCTDNLSSVKSSSALPSMRTYSSNAQASEV